MRRVTIGLLLGLAVGGCTGKGAESMKTEFAAGTFGYDAAYLKKHTETVVLGRALGRVLLAEPVVLERPAAVNTQDRCQFHSDETQVSRRIY